MPYRAPRMRFLYGDSSPFPLGYNFLTTLEAFMSAATRIVQLELEGAALVKQREEIAQNRVKGLDALEQFHNVVMGAVQDTAQKVHHQHALQYARAVAEYATRYIEQHRGETFAANDRESIGLGAEGERRAGEMRAQLEAFLKAARLPAVKTSISIRLAEGGKEPRYSGSVTTEHVEGIATAFTLSPHRSSFWSAPRKVAELLQGVELRVGVEKSWLRGTVSAKPLSVDDWTISQAETTESGFVLGLRRKLGEREGLVFHVRRSETGALSGSVEHRGTTGSEAPPGALAAQDLTQIERVWLAIRTATRDVVEQREQLLHVTLDGQPVFESGLAVPFVVRFVTMFAPTVREITRRSPNEFELTLKLESDAGRREELYLRRDALVSTLHPLPAKGRQIFAPLGLDSWVPSMTAAPPPVGDAPLPTLPSSPESLPDFADALPDLAIVENTPLPLSRPSPLERPSPPPMPFAPASTRKP